MLSCVSRELKQQRRQRLQRRHLKSKVALLQTLSRLFSLTQFVKSWQFCLELNSKRLYQSSEKEEESVRLKRGDQYQSDNRETNDKN